MDVDAEITEGKIIVGTTNRSRLECIFEVKCIIKDWVRPLKGSEYMVCHPMGGREILLRSPVGDDELADIAVFPLMNCRTPSKQELVAYNSMPNI